MITAAVIGGLVGSLLTYALGLAVVLVARYRSAPRPLSTGQTWGQHAFGACLPGCPWCALDQERETGRPSITCPRCGFTSYHPDDIANGYCGHCHDWTHADEPGGVK